MGKMKIKTFKFCDISMIMKKETGMLTCSESGTKWFMVCMTKQNESKTNKKHYMQVDVHLRHHSNILKNLRLIWVCFKKNI